NSLRLSCFRLLYTRTIAKSVRSTTDRRAQSVAPTGYESGTCSPDGVGIGTPAQRRRIPGTVRGSSSITRAEPIPSGIATHPRYHPRYLPAQRRVQVRGGARLLTHGSLA